MKLFYSDISSWNELSAVPVPVPMSKVQVPILISTAPTVEGVKVKEKEKEKEKVSEGAVCGKKDPLILSNRQTGTGTGAGSGSGSRTVTSVKTGVGVKGVISGSEDMSISLPSRWPLCLPITPHR